MATLDADSARRGCTCEWIAGTMVAKLNPRCPLHSKEKQLPLQYDWDKAIKPDARYGGEWMPSGNSELDVGTHNVTLPEGSVIAAHYSEGKPGFDQLPPSVLREWARVFTYGERKYSRDNWKNGTQWHEFYGSALRHLTSWWDGVDTDEESGLPHLAHAMWNIGTLMWYQQHERGTDDR